MTDIICRCGHLAKDHAEKNGHSHPGETRTGACNCVLSAVQAENSEHYHFQQGSYDYLSQDEELQPVPAG